MDADPVQQARLADADRELARMQRRLDLLFLRLLLQRRVRYISPLLLDLMAEERLRLERLIWRMRSGGGAARSAQRIGRYAVPLTHWRYMLPSGWQPELTMDQADRLFRDAMAGRGVPVRLPSHPKGHLGISASSEQLEVEFGTQSARVWSHREDAFVLIRTALPESVGIAIVGRPVSEVVEHAVLSTRDYPITECRISEPNAERFATTTIRFHAGRLPFAMPFGSLVDELVEKSCLRRLKGHIAVRRRRDPA